MAVIMDWERVFRNMEVFPYSWFILIFLISYRILYFSCPLQDPTWIALWKGKWWNWIERTGSMIEHFLHKVTRFLGMSGLPMVSNLQLFLIISDILLSIEKKDKCSSHLFSAFGILRQYWLSPPSSSSCFWCIIDDETSSTYVISHVEITASGIHPDIDSSVCRPSGPVIIHDTAIELIFPMNSFFYASLFAVRIDDPASPF